jgi:Fe-Mn family superoxide dismutase
MKTVFELPRLPYGFSDLEPYLSAQTLEYHYGKHHQAYVNNLNNLLAGDEGARFEGLSLVELVKSSDGVIFNNSAQAYNHSFYWHCLRAPGSAENLPSPKLLQVLEESFGSLDSFMSEFSAVAKTHFGSGWAWLVKPKDGTKLEIVGLHDAATPISGDDVPLLALDIWEHAYYLDYKNDRPGYIEAFWKLINWDFVESNLASNKPFDSF